MHTRFILRTILDAQKRFYSGKKFFGLLIYCTPYKHLCPLHLENNKRHDYSKGHICRKGKVKQTQICNGEDLWHIPVFSCLMGD